MARATAAFGFCPRGIFAIYFGTGFIRPATRLVLCIAIENLRHAVIFTRVKELTDLSREYLETVRENLSVVCEIVNFI